METPETEQPPSLPRPEASQEQVDIIIDSKGPDVPEIEVSEQESNVANGGLPTPASSPAVTPAPTAAASSAATPVATPRSGPNGSLAKGTPERMSMGGNAETVSPYINGGIFHKRNSYASSMASESMDMSVNRESISMSARVSPQQQPDPCMNMISVFLIENGFT